MRLQRLHGTQALCSLRLCGGNPCRLSKLTVGCNYNRLVIIVLIPAACRIDFSEPNLHKSSQVKMLFLSMKANGCLEDVFISQGKLKGAVSDPQAK